MRTFTVTRLIHRFHYPDGPMLFDEVKYVFQETTPANAVKMADEAKHNTEHWGGWCSGKHRTQP